MQKPSPPGRAALPDPPESSRAASTFVWPPPEEDLDDWQVLPLFAPGAREALPSPAELSAEDVTPPAAAPSAAGTVVAPPLPVVSEPRTVVASVETQPIPAPRALLVLGAGQSAESARAPSVPALPRTPVVPAALVPPPARVAPPATLVLSRLENSSLTTTTSSSQTTVSAIAAAVEPKTLARATTIEIEEPSTAAQAAKDVKTSAPATTGSGETLRLTAVATEAVAKEAVATPVVTEAAAAEVLIDEEAAAASGAGRFAGRAALVVLALAIAGGSAYLTTRWMQPAATAGGSGSHGASPVPDASPGPAAAGSGDAVASSGRAATGAGQAAAGARGDETAPPAAADATAGAANPASATGGTTAAPVDSNGVLTSLTAVPATPEADRSIAADATLLEVRSTPSGARVVVGGAFRGHTPLLGRGLPPGRHDVLIGAPFPSTLRRADVRAGRRTLLDVTPAAASPAASTPAAPPTAPPAASGPPADPADPARAAPAAAAIPSFRRTVGTSIRVY